MQAKFRPLPIEDLGHVVEHAETAWRSLRGERLFVTGATGFFGLWLLESIAAANARLHAGIHATLLSRDPQRFRSRAPHLADHPFFQWHAGDVRNFVFPPGGYGHVIHGAASSDAALYAERPAEMLETIVSGTRRVLEFAPTAGASSLLYVSSGAVYGRQPPEVSHVPETYREHSAAHATASPYAEGKRAAEALCLEASTHKGLGIKIARAFAFVGPHLPLDTHFAAGNFLRDALGGSEITVGGDGMPFRSYLHMADLVVWLVTILTRGESMRPYNVGSDEAISIEALARETARLRQPAVPVRISRRPDGRPAERYVPDVERARRELGLEVRISLHEALERTFRWLQAAPC